MTGSGSSGSAETLPRIHFDWSKTHLDEELLGAFAGLAYVADYHGARDCLFAGEIVNATENRPATHVAERGQGKPEDNRLAAERHVRMRSLVDAIEGGAFGEIDSILHIGIGGSALGPDLIIDALGRDTDRFEVRVLANIDGEAFDEATGVSIPPRRWLSRSARHSRRWRH